MINPAANEKGFLLVTAMVVLLLLTLLGIGAMRTSSIELLIAGNDKFHKEAFYSADSAVSMTPRLISEARDTGANPAVNATYLTLLDDDGTSTDTSGTRFYRVVMGYTAPSSNPDFQLLIGPLPVGVDVTHAGASRPAGGGGAEFAMGTGSGPAAGSIAINYVLTSTGTAPNNSISVVSARYRYVPGTAGGVQ